MSLSAAALTTVANLQAVVGSGISTSRCELAINAVSQAFAAYCGRTFQHDNNITEFHAGNGQERLWLRRRNITAVASVYIWSDAQTVASMDSVLPGALVSETVYRTAEHDEQGVLYRAGRWPIAAGTWGDLTGQPNLSQRGTNIRVVYSGGYSTIPADLELACIRECTLQISRPVPGLTSERTPGGWSQTFGRAGASQEQGQFSPEVTAVLDSYRLWTL